MRSIDEVIAQRTRPGLASSKPCLSLHGDEQRGRFCLSSSGSRASRDRKFESSSLQRRVICEPGPERPAALVHDRTSDLVIIAWRRPSPVRLSLPPAAAISICISARILRSVIRATPTGDVHIPPAGTDGPRRTRRGEGTRRTLGTGQISLGAGRVAGGFPATTSRSFTPAWRKASATASRRARASRRR
jgi:hypothetical protein